MGINIHIIHIEETLLRIEKILEKIHPKKTEIPTPEVFSSRTLPNPMKGIFRINGVEYPFDMEKDKIEFEFNDGVFPHKYEGVPYGDEG